MSTFAERMNDFKPVILTPCHTCEHRITGWTCAAFPRGIPEEILVGDDLHREPYEGDNGIQWKERVNE
jgi:hypothetical protein